MKAWINSGEPWVWLAAAAVSSALLMVFGLILLIAVQGMGFFWAAPVMQAVYTEPGQAPSLLIGELHNQDEILVSRLQPAWQQSLISKWHLETRPKATRYLFKIGNRERYGLDFRWVLAAHLSQIHYPPTLAVIERLEWGNAYGYVEAVQEQGVVIAEQQAVWEELPKRLQRTHELRKKIQYIEKHQLGRINYRLEKLRLQERKLQLQERLTPTKIAELQAERDAQQALSQQFQSELSALHQANQRDSLLLRDMRGDLINISLAKIVQITQPNRLSWWQKLQQYGANLWRFVSTDPREANTEGGVFPAIFGTVMMVIIMSIIVTPLGVIAAVYLHEYAKPGLWTQIIRISVNNLAGVPSIVYGVFGLGFFVYLLGGNIDALFFPEAAPAPVFGTPGIFWASLTLALLTLPVVIVATEEGLSRIPSAMREGSFALGATHFETLRYTILPMASPAIMTGFILAIARAAGEVAPLMLVGVVKLAPSLVLDSNAPFLHLERKFMHLGFHIYDVGFQSPNVEAARPLVYATALLLVLVILVLNITAFWIRARLRERYKSLEML